MIIETNTKPNWCPNCNAKDKCIAELEKAIEILQSQSNGEVIAEGKVKQEIGWTIIGDLLISGTAKLKGYVGEEVRISILQIDK